MDKLFERLNLYDILAMIFPGGLLLLCIISTGNWHDVIKEIPWIKNLMTQTIFSKSLCFGLLGVMFAYLLGVANHTLITIWRAVATRYLWIWKLVMLLCYRNEMVVNAGDKKIFELLKNSYREINTKELQSAYIEAHNCARKTKQEVMLTIEQQVAMLRNSIIPGIWLLSIALRNIDYSWTCIATIALGYLLGCGFIIWAREYKLFAIVLSTYNLQK